MSALSIIAIPVIMFAEIYAIMFFEDVSRSRHNRKCAWDYETKKEKKARLAREQAARWDNF